jgi:hypothetical protein
MRLVLIALLAGCGGAQPTDCEVPVFGRIWADFPLQCRAMAKNVESARRAMVHHEILTAEEFDSRFAGTRISIYEADELGSDATGNYDALGGISLARDGGSLVHELCHLLDTQNLDLLTPWHHGWEKKRYRAASDFFKAGARGL